MGFNANVARIDRYFEEAKRDAKRLYDLMGERERNLEVAKAQLISAFEKSQKEQDAKLKRLLVIESSIQSLRTDVEFLKHAKSKEDSKMKLQHSGLVERILKLEKEADEVTREIKVVASRHEENVVFLNRKVDSLNGPLKVALDNAQRENEALIREIGRTQDINRIIVAEKIL